MARALRFFDGAQTELGLVPLGTPPITTLPVLEQTAWRLYSDNAAPATSTALGTENTQFPVDITIQSDKQYQLRVQLQNDGASSVAAPWLAIQRRINGDAWQPLDGLATGAEVGTSVHFASGDSLSTSRLASPGGSYIAGSAVEAIPPYQTASTITAGNYSEFVWCVKIIWDEVLPGDVIEFRVIRGTSATNVLPDYMTFTQVPSIVMVRSGVFATISGTWGGWNAQAAATVIRLPITVTSWQFFLDDTSPSSAYAAAGVNVTAYFGVVVVIGIRVQVLNPDSVRSDTAPYYLEYRKPAFSLIWDLVPPSIAGGMTQWGSSWFTDSTTLIPRLPPLIGYTFVTGKAVENEIVLTKNLPPGSYSEYQWMLIIEGTGLSYGTLFEFRLIRELGGGPEEISYAGAYPSMRYSNVTPLWGIPQSVTATATSATTIRVAWTDVPHASGYDIERDGVVIAVDQPDSPYDDTGLTPGITYNYRVIAVG